MPHINEKIDYAVEVFIVYQNKVLLRKHEKYGIWLGVGGHIELDEDPNQAALREVLEEVGLEVELIDTRADKTKTLEGEIISPSFLNRHKISDSHEHIAFVYFAISNSDKVVPENATDEWLWLSSEEIEKNEIGMQKNVQTYAKKALELAVEA